MSSRMRRRTSKVAASSASTSCGAVVAAARSVMSGIFRILAMVSSNAEIGFADVWLQQKVCRQAGADDTPLLQHVGTVGDVKRLEHVLLDQQHRGAVLAYAGDDVEHIVDDGRRQSQ